jgi:hypothetical protein
MWRKLPVTNKDAAKAARAKARELHLAIYHDNGIYKIKDTWGSDFSKIEEIVKLLPFGHAQAYKAVWTSYPYGLETFTWERDGTIPAVRFRVK